MTDYFLEGFPLGMWQANCYVVGDRDAGVAVVVDPGQDAEGLVTERLAAHSVTCEAVLLTHGHLDHLWSAPAVAEAFDVPVFLHGQDRWLWDDPAAAFGNVAPGALKAQFGLDWEPPTERLEALEDGMTVRKGGVMFTVRHTPGHTPGSSVFITRDVRREAVLVSGDLIFAGSVGRTDFPRGSFEQQNESLARVVLPLDDDTLILAGHGPQSTVGVERRTNPFLQQLAPWSGDYQ